MTPSLSMRAALQQVAAEAQAIINDGDISFFATQAALRIRVTALAQINALNKATERLEAMIEANPCWFTESGRTREMGPCERSHGAYCDQCAIRWDCEILQRVLLAESPRPDKAVDDAS